MLKKDLQYSNQAPEINLHFRLTFALNLNFSTFYSSPNAETQNDSDNLEN
jgi:hypothetical protein